MGPDGPANIKLSLTNIYTSLFATNSGLGNIYPPKRQQDVIRLTI